MARRWSWPTSSTARRPRAWIEGVFAGAWIAFTHTLAALLLAGALKLFATRRPVRRAARGAQRRDGLLHADPGRSASGGCGRASPAACTSMHHGDHHDHDHDRSSPPSRPRSRTARRTMAGWLLLTAAGIAPCAGALIVILLSIALGVLWAGVLGVIAIALGMAITLAAIGMASMVAHRLIIGDGRSRGDRPLHDDRRLADRDRDRRHPAAGRPRALHPLIVGHGRLRGAAPVFAAPAGRALHVRGLRAVPDHERHREASGGDLRPDEQIVWFRIVIHLVLVALVFMPRMGLGLFRTRADRPAAGEFGHDAAVDAAVLLRRQVGGRGGSDLDQLRGPAGRGVPGLAAAGRAHHGDARRRPSWWASPACWW